VSLILFICLVSHAKAVSSEQREREPFIFFFNSQATHLLRPHTTPLIFVRLLTFINCVIFRSLKEVECCGLENLEICSFAVCKFELEMSIKFYIEKYDGKISFHYDKCVWPSSCPLLMSRMSFLVENN
jgi:hypothetical protein